MKNHFNDHVEERGPSTVVTADEQTKRGVQYQDWLGKGKKDGRDGDPSKIHGVKKNSILHDLSYWK